MNEEFYKKDFEKRKKNIYENKLMKIKDFIKKIESGEKEISGRFDFYESFDLLKNKEFKDLIFKNCEFLYGNFSNSLFKNCKFENVIFYRSDVNLLRFENCEMDECDFQNTNDLPIFFKSTVSYTSMIEV